jgi:hypothetical protein
MMYIMCTSCNMVCAGIPPYSPWRVYAHHTMYIHVYTRVHTLYIGVPKGVSRGSNMEGLEVGRYP